MSAVVLASVTESKATTVRVALELELEVRVVNGQPVVTAARLAK